MVKFTNGDKYVYWSGDDNRVYVVSGTDGLGWSVGVHWCSIDKKNYFDMVHPSKLRHCTSIEIKLNRLLHVAPE